MDPPLSDQTFQGGGKNIFYFLMLAILTFKQ